MEHLFLRWLQGRTQGSKENEMWWWDVFYRYETYFGVCIALILSFLASLSILPFVYFSPVIDGSHRELLELLGAGLFGGLLSGLIFTGIIICPLYASGGGDLVRKEDVGQASLLLSTLLGYASYAIASIGPLLILIKPILTSDVSMIIGCCLFLVCYYAVFRVVASNVKDYVNWRFSFAINNYEMLFSRHYKWWTSSLDFDVQRTNLKKFQKYKFHAIIALIMIPMIIAPQIVAYMK